MAGRSESVSRIAVVMGGVSGERDVSKATGACVAGTLKRRFKVKPVEILADGRWVVPHSFLAEGIPDDPAAWFQGPPVALPEALARLAADGIEVIFNALHGPGGEDGSFQGLCKHLGIACTGPDLLAAAVTMDKRLSKDLLERAGIRTPPGFALRLSARKSAAEEAWVRLRRTVEFEVHRVPPPWVLKPVALGSSVGVHFLDTPEDLAEALAEILPRAAEAPFEPEDLEFLVEKRLEGRELTCGVIETEGPPRALPPIEIRPRTSGFFDYQAKYTPGATEEVCPAPLDERARAAVERTAVQVHTLFRCAPLSRTDFILEPSGELSVLEINTLPGMTETSLIPLAARTAGLELEDLFAALVHHALKRGGGFRFALTRG